ncbi:glycosyltransferase [Mucilaginibacter conchicola]|uniref:Glycosyltransferase n=1 Tax=Mucilaginibacter conchicola TaxID=2303333 RepID=A0A372NZT4_9SPHI|nr:glycosyltransferase [Mucilaginibacter conchicola]RFZ95374.1 glycosyltransferase [Mucilaginibacter conchicola]
MRVIQLITGLGGGGAENLVYNLTKMNLQDKDVEFSVVYMTDKDKLKPRFEEMGVAPVSLGITSKGSFVSGLKKYYRILKNNKGAVVHAHLFHTLLISCLMQPLVPHKVVFTLHSDFVKKRARRYILFFTRFLRSADVIFSAKSKQWYQKSDAVVIANGIDLSQYNHAHNKPEVFSCLFLGRLEEPKNPMYLVELVNKLKDKHKFKIVVVGEGNMRQPLEELIAKESLQDYFEFLGFRQDIPQIMANVSCLITPSLWEGMPISLLEAGACGVPILTTPVGSIPIFLNNETAYLTELPDFHLSLQHIIENYNEALDKAAKFKNEVFEKFDINKCYQNYKAMYYKVIK